MIKGCARCTQDAVIKLRPMVTVCVPATNNLMRRFPLSVSHAWSVSICVAHWSNCCGQKRIRCHADRSGLTWTPYSPNTDVTDCRCTGKGFTQSVDLSLPPCVYIAMVIAGSRTWSLVITIRRSGTILYGRPTIVRTGMTWQSTRRYLLCCQMWEADDRHSMSSSTVNNVRTFRRGSSLVQPEPNNADKYVKTL